MLQKGTQIAYVPTHARGDARGLAHPDVQFGFVMSVRPKGGVFCRYWLRGQLGELRTRANSELTPAGMIVEHQSVDQSVVDRALVEIATDEKAAQKYLRA